MTRDELKGQLTVVRDSLAGAVSVLDALLKDLPEYGKPSEQATENGKMLSPRQAAPLLGMSKSWIYANAATLPFVRKYPGGSIRCDLAGLEQWKAER